MNGVINSNIICKFILYVYARIIQPYIKKEILPFETTLMNLEDSMHSEISKTQKDKKTNIACSYL